MEAFGPFPAYMFSWVSTFIIKPSQVGITFIVIIHCDWLSWIYIQKKLSYLITLLPLPEQIFKAIIDTNLTYILFCGESFNII